MRINILRVMHLAGLQQPEVAQQLFPKHRVPNAALDRIIKGRGALDEEQIYKLSVMAGCDVNTLYNPMGWKHKSVDGNHRFSSGGPNGYVAYYYPGTREVYLYASDTLMASQVLTEPDMALEAFIDLLTDLVIKHKQ